MAAINVLRNRESIYGYAQGRKIEGMQALIAYIGAHPGVCLVDAPSVNETHFRIQCFREGQLHVVSIRRIATRSEWSSYDKRHPAPAWAWRALKDLGWDISRRCGCVRINLGDGRA